MNSKLIKIQSRIIRSSSSRRGRMMGIVNGKCITDTPEALTLKEAAYPPVQYIPSTDVDMTHLQRTTHPMYCPCSNGERASVMASGKRLLKDVWCYEARESAAEDSEFAVDVVAGLSATHKQLPPKYFYDAIGSRLFEEICRTDEYYVTRSETALLRKVASALAVDIPEYAALVEFGSGESSKSRLLLDAAPQLSAYVPIDISADALSQASAKLARDYPQLTIAAVVADFTGHFHLPAAATERPKVGFFPGSTIGNFDKEGAVRFLRSARGVLGDQAPLLVAADLVKDAATLIAAYDDSHGVTARFNKNLLVRINRELDGDFDPDAFDHLALWNPVHSRMEMHLVSREDQIVNAAGHTFSFRNGERLHTENSHKFTLGSFAQLAATAGWSVTKTWISDEPRVAIFRLEHRP